MSLVEIDTRQLTPVSSRWQESRPLRLLAGLFALWLLTAIYIVPADQQAVVTRFGKVVEPRVMPGIHLSLPWPVDRVTKLRVQQLQRLMIGGDPSDAVLGRMQPALSQFLTGDQNLLHLRAVVQYSVSIPADYLFTAENISQLIAATVEAELTRRLARRFVDAVLTTEKAAIQEEVRAAAQQQLNAYRSGVALASVNIESAAPPAEAAEAFRDVASARADAARIVNEAQGYANDIIPKARGQAQQMLESAAAYRQRKINQALGDAARFTQLAAEYEKAAAVNGRRLYAETMEQVLPRIRKLIVDRKGNLDLTIIRKQRDAEAAKP
ncbi:MAG: FtsH protease activity modulator HflK [Bryobacteraceae bacterium]|nr:FtsH protease activity modulator HflK [Bryobacteraceae bacterium]MDW8376708.1 FtsH protease activity modulator HflK [Bryobacterales bacterium]